MAGLDALHLSGFPGLDASGQVLLVALNSRAILARCLVDSLRKRLALYPQAIIILECLRQRGIRLAVISNWDGNLRQTLQDLKILSYFEMVLDSHVVGVRKPDPAIFRLFSQACQLEPAQCIHVGDSPDADESLALSVGAIPVLYDPLQCFPSQEGHRISELSDVVEFLDNI